MLDVEILAGPASLSPTVLIIHSPLMKSLVKVTYIKKIKSYVRMCFCGKLVWRVRYVRTYNGEGKGVFEDGCLFEGAFKPRNKRTMS